MDTTPFVYVRWNSSSYMTSPSQTFTSGLSSIVTSRPDLPPAKSILSPYTPYETPIPGNAFNFTAGIHEELMGESIILTRTLPKNPAVYLTYPTEGASPDPQMAFLTFYPAFGPFSDDIYEEYLNYTILGGLSKTGK
ncbi:hypothetical protein FS837_006507 [Tulasnella sp. UAMH 9824]|nr:hypothetical protein FS837_006507 [Tulasnella sp. UAMH 9824]